MKSPRVIPRRLLIATCNRGKVREFTALLSNLPLELEGLDAHPDAVEVEEIGDTYLENAAAKAIAAARACGVPALADDSGLEVDALGGFPGVRSARYSGGSSADNVARLLAEMSAVPDARRTARFRCILVVAHPDGRTIVAEGSCEGWIAHAPRGSGGFGYDPVFIDPVSGQSFAELSSDHKDKISHRARAVAVLRPQLDEFLQHG